MIERAMLWWRAQSTGVHLVAAGLAIFLAYCLWTWGGDMISAARDRSMDKKAAEYEAQDRELQRQVDELRGAITEKDRQLDAITEKQRVQDEAIQLLATKARMEDSRITTSKQRVDDARAGRGRAAPRTPDELQRRLEALYPETDSR
jgi:chromosome segregation ATPase